LTERIAQGDLRFPHSLIIELSDDYVNPHTDPYGGEGRQVTPICSCGYNLGYEDLGYLGGEKIRRICPACGLAFRPQDQIAEIRDGISGNLFPQRGGLCNRFAISIGFGKEWPIHLRASSGELVQSNARVTGKFMDACSSALV
jgi:hypothetical protein